MLDQRVGRAQADRGRHQRHRRHQPRRRGVPAFDLECEHRPRPLELAPVGRRVEDARHGRMRREPLGEDPGPCRRLADADLEGRQAPVHEIRRDRVQECPRQDAHLPQTRCPLGARGDHSGHHVAVASQELRRAVQGEGGAVTTGVLQHRRRERVVDEHGNAARGPHDVLDVDLPQRRVLRSLEQHEAGIRADRVVNARRQPPRSRRARAGRRPGDGRCPRTAGEARRRGGGRRTPRASSPSAPPCPSRTPPRPPFPRARRPPLRAGARSGCAAVRRSDCRRTAAPRRPARRSRARPRRGRGSDRCWKGRSAARGRRAPRSLSGPRAPSLSRSSDSCRYLR